MTVLRAKVAGQWIDVTGGGAAFVGPNDPGPSYNMWYDTDAPNPVDPDTARWNSAWGMVWMATGVGGTGVTMTTSQTLTVATAPAMVFQAGRRYRVGASCRAVAPQTDGTRVSPRWQVGPMPGGIADAYSVTESGYTSMLINALCTGDGGTYTPVFNIVNGGAPTANAPITLYLDNLTGNCFIEDVGPSTPAAVVPQVPTTMWQLLPLVNGWIHYGAPYGPAYYRKVGDMVQLRGLVSSGTSATAVICGLPAGYLPQYQPIFTVTCNGGSAEVRVDQSTGNVGVQSFYPATATPTGWISLTGITYSVI